MKISRELKTGLITIIIIAGFVWSYNFIKDQNIFKSTDNTFFSEFDNVQGLNLASIVTINGYQVGKVARISFNDNPNKRGKLIVEFGVETEFKFSKNSVTKIYSTSLMGGKAIAIIPSYEGEDAVPGDYLKGEIEEDLMGSLGDIIDPLQAKLSNVLTNADSLIIGLNQILDQNSRKNLRETFEKLNSTMANFEKVSSSLDDLVANNEEKLDKSLSNLEVITDNFAQISDSLVNANLSQTIAKLETTVNSFNAILEKVDNGEGSIGKLLNDDGLYINLENASKELEELLREVKEHPKRFVNVSMFGKKDKGYQPEEKEEKVEEKD